MPQVNFLFLLFSSIYSDFEKSTTKQFLFCFNSLLMEVSVTGNWFPYDRDLRQERVIAKSYPSKLYILRFPGHQGNVTNFCFYPAGNYMFKVNNRNTRTRCEICSELTYFFIVNFEHISHLVLVFLLLTLNM